MFIDCALNVPQLLPDCLLTCQTRVHNQAGDAREGYGDNEDDHPQLLHLARALHASLRAGHVAHRRGFPQPPPHVSLAGESTVI